MRTFEGSLDASGLHVAVVVARFNELITERLLEGAVTTAREHGVAEHNLDVVWVPGAFELPLAARALAGTGRYQAMPASAQ
jgi:6,7-dimethyl-8-ribityllumazine synthase